MKWQCQCCRPVKERSEARHLLESGAFESFKARMRVQLACATSRMEIVPQVRCGDRRELASKAVTGLDI